MSDMREHYADLRDRLVALHHLFSLNGRQDGYREHFDEWLDANEFEVALHALCNFLLESSTPGIEPSEIEGIELVHQKMDLHDNCVAALREKREATGQHGDGRPGL